MPIWRTSDDIRSEKIRGFEAYWRERAAPDIAAPLRREIDPNDLRALLPHIVIVDFQAAPLCVRYRLIGTKVVDISRLDFTGKTLEECEFQAADPTVWRRAYEEIAATGAPVFGRVEIPLDGDPERAVVEEFGIFPLSHDGSAIHQCIAVEDYGAADPFIAPEKIRPMKVR
ncbi:MAG: PAS domain-containing protein [Marivibrio sp.]|uniref:PAS domain-containing protein n=1 Tax=Marivibrio sp. TaxID=2039719 RepID=UPI0032F0911D